MDPDPLADELAALRRDLATLEQAIVMANDAAFGIAGIVCRIITDAGLLDRNTLADAIEQRAGRDGSADFNPALRVFARALRMSLPGGRFEVIEGGGARDLDPG